MSNRSATSDLIYNGTSILAGGNASNAEATSSRALSANWIATNYTTSSRTWNVFNHSLGGTNVWNALVRYPAAVAANRPVVVIADWSNDNHTSDLHKFAEEAYVRKLRADFSNANMMVVLYPVATGGTYVETPPSHTQFKAICDHYDIPYVDVHAALGVELAGGATLDDYYTSPDYVHPADAGHQLAFEQMQLTLPTVINGGQQWSGNLADYARLYASSADYENDSTRLLGTEYADRTGTWSDTDTRTQSSEAGATITFTATCQSIGLYRADSGTSQSVEVSIDGGAYAAMTLDYNGRELGVARGEHTIAIKVVSGTVRIDEFWAI